MFNNTTFVNNHSVTSNGSVTFSVSNDISQKENVIDYEAVSNARKNKKKLFYYKVINFKKTLKIQLIWVSLHIGDIIDFITKNTGIKSLIVKWTRGKCGCEARRQKFNKWFSLPIPKIWFDSHDEDDSLIIKMTESVKTVDHYENIKQNIIDQGTKYIEGKPFGIRHYYEPQKIEQRPNNTKPSGCGCQSKMKKTVTTL